MKNKTAKPARNSGKSPILPLTPSPAAAAASGAEAAEPQTFPAKVRELADEFAFMFVIIMFTKIFLVELYQIPTGSMTPELLGGTVAEVDVNHDGLKDLVLWEMTTVGLVQDRNLVFLNKGGRRELALGLHPTAEQIEGWRAGGLIHEAHDRILVNKMVYWFRQPKRGEVVVFKVPDPPFTAEAPIYIKRLAGEPGERLTFIPDPATNGQLAQLAVNGKPVETPEFYKRWRYRPAVDRRIEHCLDLPNVHYTNQWDGTRHIDQIDVPKGQIYMFGDNTEGSLDSRFWGGVPLENAKGRAFMRVWPLRRFGYIH